MAVEKLGRKNAGAEWNQDWVKSLVAGTRYASNGELVLKYNFSKQGREVGDGTTTFAWLKEEKAAMKAAFDLWSDVANVRFVEVAKPKQADLHLGLFSGDAMREAGLSDDPQGQPAKAGASGPTAGQDGYVMFSASFYSRAFYTAQGVYTHEVEIAEHLQPGALGFQLMVHEIGHVLGLSHPFEKDGTSTPFPQINQNGGMGRDLLNQGVYTTMSYHPGWFANPKARPEEGQDNTDPYNKYLDYDYLTGLQKGPMALDIAAVQALYGARKTNRPGDDVYLVPGDWTKNIGWSSVYDTGGIDTFAYGGSGSGSGTVTIDLRPATLNAKIGGVGGYLSYFDANVAGAANGGLTIARGTIIENAIGSSSDDVLIGNHVGNRLEGGYGENLLIGRAGDDTLIGDSSDTLVGDFFDPDFYLMPAKANVRVFNRDYSGRYDEDDIFGQVSLADATFAQIPISRDGNGVLGEFANASLFELGGSFRPKGATAKEISFYKAGANGNDSIVADGGSVVIGGGGNDTISTDEKYGDDCTLLGGDGRDLIISRAGGNILYGGAGADTLVGAPGGDVFLLPDPNDTIIVKPDEAASDTLVSVSSNMSLTSDDGAYWQIGNIDYIGTKKLNLSIRSDKHTESEGREVRVGDAGSDVSFTAGVNGNGWFFGGSNTEIVAGRGTDVVRLKIDPPEHNPGSGAWVSVVEFDEKSDKIDISAIKRDYFIHEGGDLDYFDLVMRGKDFTVISSEGSGASSGLTFMSVKVLEKPDWDPKQGFETRYYGEVKGSYHIAVWGKYDKADGWSYPDFEDTSWLIL